MIDLLSLDRYLLMQNPANPPTTTPNLPVEIIVTGAVLLSIITVATAIIFTKKKENKDPKHNVNLTLNTVIC